MTTPKPLERTQHRNLVTGADLGGSTVHREIRVDIEDYLEPIAAASTKALHGPGVAISLHVTATKNQPGLQSTPGVAIDQRGRTVALQDGGVAVTDPNADATTARNVPTVDVTPTGVTLDTTGLTGDRVLTLAWAEAEAGGATLLRHSPLGGTTTPALSLLGTGALSAPGGLAVTGTLTAASTTVTALTATSVTATSLRAGTLTIDGATTLTGPTTFGGPLTVSSLTATSLTANGLTAGVLEADSLSTNDLTVTTTVDAGGALTAGGPVTIGTAAAQNRRTLHVVGSEIHSGGGGGGYSFSDRNVTEVVNIPSSGQRWVWYALGGSARLWSGGDRLLVSPSGTITFPAGDFGKQDGPTTLSLWGSRIFDPGGGTLFLRSGGGVVAFDGGDNVGIGTANPQSLLHVNGRLFANLIATPAPKQFVIDHPLDPDRKLAHACVEGPEAAVYYRGEARLVDGIAHVTLPRYFEALVRAGGRTVQLTAVADLDEPVAVLAATPVVDGTFAVRAATDVNPAQRFHWQVTAVRADVEPLQVEIERPPAAVEEEMAHA